MLQGVPEVFAAGPAGKDVLPVLEGVDIAAELHVVLAKNVVEVVLRLELGVVVIGRQEELLAEDAGIPNEHCRRIAIRAARALLGRDQQLDLVHFARPENTVQREDRVDSLVVEVLRVVKGVGRLVLAVAPGKAVGVIAREKGAYAEVLRRARRGEEALPLDILAEEMRRDFNRHLIADGTVAGYAIFEPGHDRLRGGLRPQWL